MAQASALPMLLLFAFGQRYFMAGVATQGRKGRTANRWLYTGDAAGGQLDLCRAKDAHDRGDSRCQLRRIGHRWLRRPFDQYCGRRIRPLH
jgi:hypothetical protein